MIILTVTLTLFNNSKIYFYKNIYDDTINNDLFLEY